MLLKGRRQLIGETVTRFVEETLRATITAPIDSGRERRVRQIITDPRFKEHLGRIKKAAADTDIGIDQRLCEVIQAINQLYRTCGLEGRLDESLRLKMVTLLLNIFRQPDEDEIHERRQHQAIVRVRDFINGHLTRQDRLPRQDELIAEAEAEIRGCIDVMREESLTTTSAAIQIMCTVSWLLAKLKSDLHTVQKDIATFTDDLAKILASRR